MNTDQFEGKWKQLKGKAKEQFGKLTDDDIQTINGKRDVLIGKLQERYGYAREEAQKRADEWMGTMQDKDMEYSHSGTPSSKQHNR